MREYHSNEDNPREIRNTAENRATETTEGKEFDYENFTVGMGLVDFLPVIFFGVAMIIVGLRMHSILYLIGAGVCLLGGIFKATRKMSMGVRKRDIPWMNYQFRYTMSVGTVLMLIGTIVKWKSISWDVVGRAMVSFPAVIFLAIGILGMVGMIILAKTLDSTKASSNWKEQITNAIAQGCIMIAVLLM